MTDNDSDQMPDDETGAFAPLEVVEDEPAAVGAEEQSEQPEEAEVPKSEAQLQCEQFLTNAGIDPQPFLDRLAARKPAVTPEIFASVAAKAFEKEKAPGEIPDTPFYHSIQAALTLRAIFLESKDPIKTEMSILHLAGARHGKGGAKAASVIGLMGDGKAAIKHYTGLGILSTLGLLWDARRLIEIRVENQGFKMPKVGARLRTEATGFNERVLEIAEMQLDRLLPPKKPGFFSTHKASAKAIAHISEFVSMDPSSFQAVVRAVKNVMKNPKSRELILKRFDNSGTLKFEVGKLCDFIDSKALTAEQKKQAYEAIEVTFGAGIAEALSLRDIGKAQNLWVEVINRKYSGVPNPLEEALNEFKEGLDGHPIATYQAAGKVSKELNEEAVALMLKEALGITAELHGNDYNIQRISQFVTLMTKERGDSENKAEFLAEFWAKESVARARASGQSVDSENETREPELLQPKEPQKIAFQNQPAVNLGAAVVSVGLAAWVSKVLGKKHKDKDGKEHPPSGWKKAAKWVAILSLTAVTGMALWRAGTLAREDGTSWVERVFDPSLVSGGRAR